MEKVLLNLLTPAIPPEWIKILPLGQVKLGDDRKPFTTDLDSLTAVGRILAGPGHRHGN